MNVIVLVGNVGRKPELRYSEAGNPECRWTLATHWQGDGGRKDIRTDWHHCTAYGRIAQAAHEHLKAGREVSVFGYIKYYRDTNGWTAATVIVERLEFLRRGTQGTTNGPSTHPESGEQKNR